MLTDIYGDLGSGKTLLMVYFAWKNPDIPVIANFNVKFKNVQKLELENIVNINYEKALILCDELYTIMDSRSSMSNINKYFSYFLFQSRKRGVDILASSQLLSSVDIRFKDLSSMSIIALGKNDKGFTYDCVIKSIFGYRISRFILPYAIAEKLYDKYDTLEVVLPRDIEDLSVEIQNPKKLNEIIDNLADEIISRKEEFCLGKKITEKKLHDILLQMGKPESLAFYLASRLEQKLNLSNC
jgi:hypothetical protein